MSSILHLHSAPTTYLNIPSYRLSSSQTHFSLLYLAYVCPGHRGLRRHDVPDQRHLRLGQHRLHAAAAPADSLPQSHLQLGLHQPGADFSPGLTQTHTHTPMDNSALLLVEQLKSRPLCVTRGRNCVSNQALIWWERQEPEHHCIHFTYCGFLPCWL